MSGDRPKVPGDRVFAGPGQEPLAALPPDQALARSRERLRRLTMLAHAPNLTPKRRKVVSELVRAETAIVSKRMEYLRRLN